MTVEFAEENESLVRNHGSLTGSFSMMDVVLWLREMSRKEWKDCRSNSSMLEASSKLSFFCFSRN